MLVVGAVVIQVCHTIPDQLNYIKDSLTRIEEKLDSDNEE